MKVITVEQAAVEKGVSVTTMKRWMKGGKVSSKNGRVLLDEKFDKAQRTRGPIIEPPKKDPHTEETVASIRAEIEENEKLLDEKNVEIDRLKENLEVLKSATDDVVTEVKEENIKLQRALTTVRAQAAAATENLDKFHQELSGWRGTSLVELKKFQDKVDALTEWAQVRQHVPLYHTVLSSLFYYLLGVGAALLFVHECLHPLF